MKNLSFFENDPAVDATQETAMLTKVSAAFAGSLLVAGAIFGAAKAVEEFTHFEPSVSQIHDQIVNGNPHS
jgi:hypothetical protein